MDDMELQLRFPHLRRIESPPALPTVFGVGMDLYGGRDYDEHTNTCVKSRCLCVLGIPVLALGAYRVVDRPGGYLFLGSEPLSSLAKTLNCLMVCLALALGGYGGWRYYSSSPEYIAGQMLADADRHIATGEIVAAAALYGKVAEGQTSHTAQAQERLKELVAGPLRKATPEEAAAVLQVAVALQQRALPAVRQEELVDCGMAIVDAQAASHPFGAFKVLEAIGPLVPDTQRLAKLRRQLLEQAVARNPKDPEPACALAVVYEAQGELAKCEALLMPHVSRLGDQEGARILGHLFATQGKLEQARDLLQAYTESRLTRLKVAEQAFQDAMAAAQQRLMEEIKNRKAPGFPYAKLQGASEREIERLWQDYAGPRLEADPQIKTAQEVLVRESGVVPVALELGMVLLQHGRTLPDAAARRRELEKAEETFLAVRTLTGKSDEYRLNLAQVYYWLGKHREGRQLFDEVLAAKQRQTAAMLQVAQLLREVGEQSAARTLIEEAYEKEADPRRGYQAAAARAFIPLDLDDQIAWLEKADPADSEVKALLSAARGRKAIREGKEQEAVGFLRDARDAYDRQPENPATLNNSALACLSLYHLTGDRRDFDQYVARLEKGIAQAPSHALLLGNAANALLQSGLGDILGDKIDLGALRLTSSVGLLSYVCPDEASRARLAEQVSANPKVAKARADFERLLVLAPKSVRGYSSLASLLEFMGDRQGLGALLQQLEGAELDLADGTRETLEHYAGKKDGPQREEVRSTIQRYEIALHALRGKPGRTFGVAAATLSATLIRADELGLPADADTIVRLAEEGHAASPSEGTYLALTQALSFRVNQELARRDPTFQALYTRAKRSTHPIMLLAAAVAGNAKRSEAIHANPDFQRLVAVVLAYDHHFSARPDPWRWVLLRIANSDQAGPIAERIRADQIGELKRAITLRISPLDVSNALEFCWQQQIAGKEADGQAILKRLRQQGAPLPLEVK